MFDQTCSSTLKGNCVQTVTLEIGLFLLVLSSDKVFFPVGLTGGYGTSAGGGGWGVSVQGTQVIHRRYQDGTNVFAHFSKFMQQVTGLSQHVFNM